MQNQDIASRLQQQVKEAIRDKTPLQITAGNSKLFYGRKVDGKSISVSDHQGILSYQPSELVLSARCGTPLVEIEQTLASKGQMLACEPPHFAPSATLGGMVACGLSGPRRPFTGSVRDFILGCKMINGKGEILAFGGEVIKNVAGYDVSRLMAGSMGTLGVILEISLKVLPVPEHELTCCFEVAEADVFATMADLAGKAQLISGLAWYQGLLYVRLSGPEKAVLAIAEKLGGHHDVQVNDRFWWQLREHELEFFRQPGALWRLSVPPATACMDLAGDWLHDWGGAQRWLKTDAIGARIFAAAERVHGHAQLFRGGHQNGDVFQPLPTKLRQLNDNIKHAFDPSAIFNPNRIYRSG